ncbi:putative clathrin assembly protein At1g03050 [Punica granatum]|uniref:ENTH domain-containing protein n=2 Tax=Punica granatum TaxID=22663 RepID=A0A218XJ28_PUNGR|nr:putative clathrin assembly protein At1g03050 [Punica granatum]OWM84947.1 hypothetical protein CDL15_Pgr027734 [Punica granatum]PKI45986.1 hypothetical protein CRG98_033626 [Punica granatum]
MAPSKFRRALGAVKDQTSIGLAKVGNSSSLSDLDVAIVKATRHEEFPADEKHIQEILSLTCYSRAHISACVSSLSRRLNKTRNWTVALKTLMLIQRLLAEGDPAYEQEIFFATRRGTRLLNMSDFRDSSRWDYSAFVRTYALYLDERLEHKIQGRRGKRSTFACDEEDRKEADANQNKAIIKATPLQEMKIEQLFSKLHHLQQLLERFLACRPTGGAKNNRVVFVALYPIVKESFQIYYEMTDIMAILIDGFAELDVPNCVKIYEMFTRTAKQLEQLDSFYSWCNSVGLARSSEYPEVERITQKKLNLMDDFIRDKATLAQDNRAMSLEPKSESVQESSSQPETGEEDMNSIKALPPPEGFTEASTQEEKPEEEKNENLQLAVVEADLLNLGEDAVRTPEHGDQLALALFDGAGPTTATSLSGPAWEAFNDNTPDWENALVQSASRLSNQQTASMGGGFDMLLLNGMYQQGAVATAAASSQYGGSGSASSIALGSAGRPAATLALPALPTGGPNSLPPNADPFAPSLAVVPPPYVQMSDLENKQRLLMEEQRMWQQYTQNGMQGQLGFSNLQANPYNMGGYTRSY